MERRRRTRVDVHLHCQVDRSGTLEPSEWKSIVNISRGGMLIRWGRIGDAPPAVGETVIVRLERPARRPLGRTWKLFLGRVVRVASTDAKSIMVALAGSPVTLSAGRKPSALVAVRTACSDETPIASTVQTQNREAELITLVS
jgi:hypothetical protein